MRNFGETAYAAPARFTMLSQNPTGLTFQPSGVAISRSAEKPADVRPRPRHAAFQVASKSRGFAVVRWEPLEALGIQTQLSATWKPPRWEAPCRKYLISLYGNMSRKRTGDGRVELSSAMGRV